MWGAGNTNSFWSPWEDDVGHQIANSLGWVLAVVFWGLENPSWMLSNYFRRLKKFELKLTVKEAKKKKKSRIILCLHLTCFALERTEIGDIEVKVSMTQPCERLRSSQTLDPSLIWHICVLSRWCSSGPQRQGKISEPWGRWCRPSCELRIL